MSRAALMLVFVLAIWPVSGLAVQPDEILEDPALEERARELSKGLRCLVCRNESIDESNADLARDLRLLVRERLVQGDSDAEVITFLVDRYGEYVLLKPTLTGSNLLLWIAGPMLLLGGVGIAAVYIRRRSSASGPEGLSDADEARVQEILRGPR